MNNPQTRVTEFLRQYKLGSGQYHVDITGVHKDVDARMAMLTVPDLEALVAFVEEVRAAQAYNKGGPFNNTMMVNDALRRLDNSV